MIDVNTNPTKKDLVVFGLLWAVFFVVLAQVARTKPSGLAVGAIITGTALVVSWMFNREHPRKMQMMGLAIPIAMLAIWGARKVPGIEASAVGWVLIGIGVVGGLGILISGGLGKWLYVSWMSAAAPVGWTFARLILGLVLFLALTPIGIILRATGRDPLERSLDRSAKTYWKPYTQAVDPARYYRQF